MPCIAPRQAIHDALTSFEWMPICFMRTTLVIDDDVLDHARSLASKLDTPFRQDVNEALRVGLKAVEEPARKRPYRTEPRRMGLKPGRNLDDIQGLLAQIEGEDQR
jgi:hypothetical protein